MAQINMPDPQHLMYDALRAEVDRLCEAGVIDVEDVQYGYDCEPESVVFFGEDLDHDYVDIDEAMDTIRMVGERDLQAKIDHWTTFLQNINEEITA